MMKIVLISDTSKNDLLVNFCIAYQQILNRHELISPPSTARLIADATLLRPLSYSSDASSTFSQLAGIAHYNEIDAVIYLRDPDRPLDNPQQRLLQACDTNSIPFATNTATAEILVLAISRGDLDWRELVRTNV
ncbi:MAG: methylglyoxal synthase [Saccharofermentanales bacterium]|jgi:methylglyoxal synthase|nr:methylglyoxal synthase [Clostridiaceae bacterium]